MVAAMCALTLLMAHHTTFFHGFSRVQGSKDDTRLINYILEYSYLAATHERHEIWNPPLFYPERNVAARTDLLFTAAPLYWPWRAAGLAPHAAYQAWLLTCTATTFFAFFALLALGLRLPSLPAACGAALYAGGAPRTLFIANGQLMLSAFMLLSLLALVLALRGPAAPPARGRRAWLGRLGLYLVFTLGASAQVYCSFYLAYFYLLGLCLALAVALARRPWRRHLLGHLRRDWPALLAAVALAALSLAPMAAHYLEIARQQTGPSYGHSYQSVRWAVPSLLAWFNLGPTSVAHRWLGLAEWFPLMVYEVTVGLGWTSLLVAAVGIARGRSRAGLILGLVALLMVLLCSDLGWGLSPWKLVHQLVPAARAIRVVSRVSLLVHVAVAAGLALYLTWALRSARRWHAALALALAAICLVEQVRYHSAFDAARVRRLEQRIAARVDPGAQSFVYVVLDPQYEERPLVMEKQHVDAMWASLHVGVPTLNGFTGISPPTYPLVAVQRDTEGYLGVLTGTMMWAMQKGLLLHQVQPVVLRGRATNQIEYEASPGSK